MTGLSTLGSNNYLPSIEYSNTLQFTDNLTKNLGRHSMKVGFEIQHLRFSILQPPTGRGAWNFSGVYTEVPETSGGNTGLAQLLLTPIPGTVAGAANYVGGADNVSASNIANTDMTRNYYGTYFQDDYQSHFQVDCESGHSLGILRAAHRALWRAVQFSPLRSERRRRNFCYPRAAVAHRSRRISTPPREAIISDVVCSSLPGLGHSQLGNFSPRVGFAYQIHAETGGPRRVRHFLWRI